MFQQSEAGDGARVVLKFLPNFSGAYKGGAYKKSVNLELIKSGSSWIVALFPPGF